jgi:hypothetical protein
VRQQPDRGSGRARTVRAGLPGMEVVACVLWL